ncbi:MAG: cupin domain-containing protein [Alphaproteobacteria bacterium]
MTKEQFEESLRCEGYQVYYGGFRAELENPDHVHGWDARLMILGGEMTITRDGKAETFRTGDTCVVPANYPHAEKVGPRGVAFIAGRK